MSPAVPAAVHLLIVSAIVWAVICRARLMDPSTYSCILWQHRLLAAAAVWSLWVPDPWRAPLLALGVVAFLGLSAPRWRHEAPAGTRPAPLEEIHDE